MLAFGVPELGSEEEAAVIRTLRSRWIGTGPEVAAFEREFCDAMGVGHAVAVSSCTAALHLALLAAGVGRGDEVVTTPLTFVGTVNAIEYAGAEPVLAEIDPETLNLDPEAVRAAISPRTRAILPVHFGGRPCQMETLNAIAEERGIVLVEDAAHAVGAAHADGKKVGAGPGDACFSFYPNKNLTTCEGGMITTACGERARRYRRLRTHGLSADAWQRLASEQAVTSRAVELGFKYNMTDLQAALGRVQLAKLEAFTRIRNEQASQYREAFADLTRFESLPPLDAGRGRHAYHFFTVRVSEMTRDAALRGLRRLGIGAAVHYEPIHLHPYYRRRLGLVPGSFPAAEQAGATTLTLPLGPALRPTDVERVISAVRELDRRPLSRPPRVRLGAAAARPASRGPSSPRPTTGAAGSPDAPS